MPVSFPQSSKDLTAQNTFTDWLAPQSGKICVTVEGTFSATIQLQRQRLDSTGEAVGTVLTKTLAGVDAYNIDDYGHSQYRVGIPTGGYTSGTATCTIEEVL